MGKGESLCPIRTLTIPIRIYSIQLQEEEEIKAIGAIPIKSVPRKREWGEMNSRTLSLYLEWETHVVV